MSEKNEDLQKLALGTLMLVKEFQYALSQRTDLDRVAFELLMLVKRRGEIRITSIANELEFNPSSITRRVQALKQSGHIAVVADPTDLRSSLIRLTPAGEEALTQFFDRSVAGLAHMLQDWSKEDIRTVAASISRYAGAMSAWRSSSQKPKEETADEQDKP